MSEDMKKLDVAAQAAVDFWVKNEIKQAAVQKALLDHYVHRAFKSQDDAQREQQREKESESKRAARKLGYQIMQGDIDAHIIVYEIYCRHTGMRYIGYTTKSFAGRYPNGLVDHDNPRLKRDIEQYGLSSLTITITRCDSAEQALVLERERILRADPSFLYNMMLK
jgi:predicted GIY-YIG superfamily endonuclease